MEKNIQRNGLINLLALLGVGVAGFAVARQAGSQAGQIAAAFIAFGVLVAFISWFQMRLEERERLEKLELEEMARSKASSTLFEGRESELLPAQRAREQFQRFFVPIFTTILFISQVVVVFFLWRWLASAPVVISAGSSLVALALFGLLALVLFILGRFSVTIARLEDNRLLRPSAGYMLLGAYLCAAVALGIGLIKAEFPMADLYVARGICVLLGIVAVETLLTLILEIYRPRVKGKVGRPLYESRLVGHARRPAKVHVPVDCRRVRWGVVEPRVFEVGRKHAPTRVEIVVEDVLLSLSRHEVGARTRQDRHPGANRRWRRRCASPLRT